MSGEVIEDREVAGCMGDGDAPMQGTICNGVEGVAGTSRCYGDEIWSGEKVSGFWDYCACVRHHLRTNHSLGQLENERTLTISNFMGFQYVDPHPS